MKPKKKNDRLVSSVSLALLPYRNGSTIWPERVRAAGLASWSVVPIFCRDRHRLGQGRQVRTIPVLTSRWRTEANNGRTLLRRLRDRSGGFWVLLCCAWRGRDGKAAWRNAGCAGCVACT
jgi:hypothetical protein